MEFLSNFIKNSLQTARRDDRQADTMPSTRHYTGVTTIDNNTVGNKQPPLTSSSQGLDSSAADFSSTGHENNSQPSAHKPADQAAMINGRKNSEPVQLGITRQTELPVEPVVLESNGVDSSISAAETGAPLDASFAAETAITEPGYSPSDTAVNTSVRHVGESQQSNGIVQPLGADQTPVISQDNNSRPHMEKQENLTNTASFESGQSIDATVFANPAEYHTEDNPIPPAPQPQPATGLTRPPQPSTASTTLLTETSPAPKQETPQVRIGHINILVDDQAAAKPVTGQESSTPTAFIPFGLRGL